jgi:hypothetical protein
LPICSSSWLDIRNTLDEMDANPGVGFVAAKNAITEGLDARLVARAAEIKPEIYERLEPQLEVFVAKQRKS